MEDILRKIPLNLTEEDAMLLTIHLWPIVSITASTIGGEVRMQLARKTYVRPGDMHNLISKS